MHDDLIFNELFVGDIRGTSSDAYYINPHNLDDSTYWWFDTGRSTTSAVGTGFMTNRGWLTNSSIYEWIDTDKTWEVVRPFMVPCDIDDWSFDDCEYHPDGINALLNDSSEVA